MKENDEHNHSAHLLKDPTRVIALTDGVFVTLVNKSHRGAIPLPDDTIHTAPTEPKKHDHF